MSLEVMIAMYPVFDAIREHCSMILSAPRLYRSVVSASIMLTPCRIRGLLSLFEEAALEDLEGFEMIWVISHMHLNKGWNSKVRPPRLPEERKGLFSTRSPHRPNPVALSSLRVRRVDAARGVIYVRGLDLLDGKMYMRVIPRIRPGRCKQRVHFACCQKGTRRLLMLHVFLGKRHHFRIA